MRYIKIYPNSGAVQTALDQEELGKPYIAFVEDGRYIDWNGLSPTPPTPPEPDYRSLRLTFEILSGGTLNLNTTRTGTDIIKVIYYSVNGGEVQMVRVRVLDGTPEYPTINVSTGDKIEFFGTNKSYLGGDVGNSVTFSGSTAIFNAYGNIMSLSYNDFQNVDTLVSAFTYQYLFEYTKIVDASHLILPATGLAGSCYRYMFNGCSSLEYAPELPAETLAKNCYEHMFDGCRKLNYLKCLATNISATNSTTYWLQGVSSTGTFVKHPNMNSWPSGTSGIPTGWTVQDAVL